MQINRLAFDEAEIRDFEPLQDVLSGNQAWPIQDGPLNVSMARSLHPSVVGTDLSASDQGVTDDT